MAPYMTPADVRLRQPTIADDQEYPDDELARKITSFERLVERYRGTSYVHRESVQTVRVTGSGKILLESVPVVSIDGFTVAGVAGTVGNLTTDSQLGEISGGGWGCGQEVVINLTTGLSAVPDEPVLDACAEYVRSEVMAAHSGTSRNVIAQGFDGAMTRYSTPDWDKGRPTGWLDVDAKLNQLEDYRIPGIG